MKDIPASSPVPLAILLANITFPFPIPIPPYSLPCQSKSFQLFTNQNSKATPNSTPNSYSPHSSTHSAHSNHSTASRTWYTHSHSYPSHHTSHPTPNYSYSSPHTCSNTTVSGNCRNLCIPEARNPWGKNRRIRSRSPCRA